MSVAEEIREQQKKSLSTMTTGEKLAYFWDYYKVHVLVAAVVLALTAIFIYQYATNKDYAFYASLVNAELTDANYELADVWIGEFQEYAQIDPDEYQTAIDTSVSLSDDNTSQYSISNQEKMLAMMQVGAVSTIVAETETFEKYAQFGYFYDLESLLSEEELAKYRPYFYYTDAATFDEGDDDTYYDSAERKDPAALTIDHRDPAAMEQPIAAGIILTEDNRLAEAGYYAYLESREHDYQGYPSDVVLGIPVTNKEPELVLRFLEYLKLGED